MNKEDRLNEITRLIDLKGTVRVTEIVETLNVSDMTVRRDLTELEERGTVTRTHGGARSNSIFKYKELSHTDKSLLNIKEKQEIAQKATELIEEGDKIFLGPGTTVELLAEVINVKSLQIITNCLPVFNIISKKKSDILKVYLIGGEMREVTQSFVGEIANMVLDKMHFTKMFFSSNAVRDSLVMTSSFEEGYIQKKAMEHSLESYLLLDSSKIGKEDFSTFADLSEVTAVITNKDSTEKYQKLKKYADVIY